MTRSTGRALAGGSVTLSVTPACLYNKATGASVSRWAYPGLWLHKHCYIWRSSFMKQIIEMLNKTYMEKQQPIPDRELRKYKNTCFT